MNLNVTVVCWFQISGTDLKGNIGMTVKRKFKVTKTVTLKKETVKKSLCVPVMDSIVHHVL